MSESPDSAHRSLALTSPVGPVFVAHHNRCVSGLLIVGDRGRAGDHGDFEHYMRDHVDVDVVIDPDSDSSWAVEITRALDEGRSDVPVDLSSRSAFQERVLDAVVAIPRGEVRTYAEVAAAVGRPKAARAVGFAMARNPIPLLVPCHRVVRTSGGIGGYAYGVGLKRWLLEREGVSL